MKAQDFLKAGLAHMQERAVTHDKPAGERSIPATVAAFKAITGDGLMNTEERGWLFMQLLKAVRSQQGEFNKDNYEDGASYCGLAGESAYVERCLKPAIVIMPDAVTGNWPASADERMEPIMQNGNDGDHYDELDMSDPANWREGDWLEYDGYMVIAESDGAEPTGYVTYKYQNNGLSGYDLAKFIKWHSRPSTEEIIQDNIVTKAPGDVFIQTDDGETARFSAAGYAASKDQLS